MNSSLLTYPQAQFYEIRMVKSASSETETEASMSERETDEMEGNSQKSPKSAPVSLCNSPQNAKLPICKIQPIKGAYYKNRTQFFTWMRKECSKLQLSVQTFAGAIGLMDRYFKQNVFNVKDFSCAALCMLIISSKLNETKILYTPVMARKSKIAPQKMEEMEVAVMVWFKFKVNAYNYVRVLIEYMREWDEMVTRYGQERDVIRFLLQEKRNYLVVQELLYICEQQLKHNKELLRSTMKIIFSRVVQKENKYSLQPLIDMLFSLSDTRLVEQYDYAFEYTSEDSCDYPTYISKVKADIQTWLDQFILLKPCFEKRYDDFQQNPTSYGTFLTLLL